MGPVFRSHQPQFVLDDETWEAFLKTAEARREEVGAMVAYAIELFMDREGFTPEWAAQPTAVVVPAARRRRAARRASRVVQPLDAEP